MSEKPEEGYTPAFYALIRLHAELHGMLKRNEMEADKLRDDMMHVEAVLKLVSPGFNARRIAARRKNNPNPIFKRGTIFRAALEILRDAAEPMTAEEIATALLRSKGVLRPSIDDKARMYGAVNSTLNNRAGKTVERIDDWPRRWRIIPG